ncbi:hypothetical protein GCM10007304_32570 [Rhodococcoides trifolii]|uniref:UPF0311 protein GCM10007304_32570 n=1 Tax=Rhodococcoides trifolii TaxID=908250 RepID=A0A917G090_9NOCA|nr:DUF3237 family protein [Rhodococcus trifolii]GGG15987.1 hypothetical protein GCM10007304_32570 [Rhodococcus trifolii]
MGVAPLSTTHVTHLSVDVGDPIDLADTPDGARRLVPIVGGRATGAVLSGLVVPGAVDTQIRRTETHTDIDAAYAILTTDGERVYVRNRGIRVASAEDTASLAEGRTVDAARVYFRGFVRLETSVPRLAWMNDRLFVARGERYPTTVEIDVFTVD